MALFPVGSDVFPVGARSSHTMGYTQYGVKSTETENEAEGRDEVEGGARGTQP